jgi:hypothetical protein
LYADILGWTEKARAEIKVGKGIDYLRLVHRTLSAAYVELREQAAPGTKVGAPFFDINIFTDNVAIAFPALGSRRYAESEIVSMFFVFRRFQAALARAGLFLRGAVAFGDHYQDNDFVLGEALLEAIESGKSGPPRIVLTPSIVELVKIHIKFYGDVRQSPHFCNLFMDTDGFLFLDYLSNAFGAFPDGPIFFDNLRSHQQNINDGLLKYRGDVKVLKKFQWLAGYHNFVLKHFMDENPLPYEPDEEDYARAAHVDEVAKFAVDHDEEFPHPTHLGVWWDRICQESQI